MVNQDRFGDPGTLDHQLQRIRKEYAQAVLTEDRCASEPLAQLELWLKDALHAEIAEPNAMVLATVDESGAPSARAVLLKQLSTEGLIFFSNYGSRKAREIERNQRVAATFVWEELERQVRVEGVVSKVSRQESETYFRSRPRASQLASAVSHQSERLHSRKELEDAYRELEKCYTGTEVPLPDRWGGFLIRPHRVEFWQGRESRLHDRIAYERSLAGQWDRFRLWP